MNADLISALKSLPSELALLGLMLACGIVFVHLRRRGIEGIVRRIRTAMAPTGGNVTRFRRLPKRRTRSASTWPRSLWKAYTSTATIVALVVVLLAVFNAPSRWFGSSETIAGIVTHVRDGDTIEVNGLPIRLSGLTCDELGTPLGNKAKSIMYFLVNGRTLTCELTGDMTYDREVGRCKLLDGRDIGAVMISTRTCGRCARYDQFRDYSAAQEKAGPFAGTYPTYCWGLW